jgi:flagellin
MAINDVSLTSGMRSNLLSLQNTVNLLNRTQSRLSSGKKVNSAIDNPTSFFASKSLTDRASIIDSLKDAMGQAFQTITAADKGITAITSMIEQAKGIAQSALSATAGSNVATENITLSGISAVVGSGFATGDVTIAGLTAPTSTGYATGTITLAGITSGVGTGKDTGTLTVATALTATNTVIIGGITFTGTNGAATAGTTEFDISSGNTTTQATALKNAINNYGWGGGAVTFHATSATNVVTLSENNTADGSVDVVAGDMNVTGSAAHVTKLVVGGAGDQIIIGGLTFKAVSDNAVAASGEFLASGSDAMKALSLKAAMVAATWGTNTYTATVDSTDNTKLNLAKTVTAGGAGANFVLATDVTTTGSNGHATAVKVNVPTGDVILVGGITLTAVNSGATGNQFNVTGTLLTDLANLRDAINADATSYTASVVNNKLHMVKNGADFTSTAADIDTTGIAGTTSIAINAAQPADKIIVGGVTFTATAAAPGAGEFLASTNNNISMESLKDAIHNYTWVGTTYDASLSNGVINVTKATAAGAATAVGAGDINVAGANGHAPTATIVAGTSELSDLADQYATMKTQIDMLAENSGYKGKNLLSASTGTLGKLDVAFENTTLTVQGFDATTGTAGLNITAATTGTTDWTDLTNGTTYIGNSVTQLDNALTTLRQNSSKLAGNLSIITVRQDFSTNMINTLTAGSDLLTLADANEEGANMLMLQTRQSLSTTALSLSAQAAQSVLRLFQ